MPGCPRRTSYAAAFASLLLAPAVLSGCGGDAEASGPPTIADLTTYGGTIRVDLGSTFDNTLRQLGVTPGSFQAARLTADTPGGTLLIPISGGRLGSASSAPAGVAGTLEAEGAGFTMTRDDQTLTIGNFTVDLTHSVIYGDVAVGATVQATHLVLFDLDDRKLRSTTTADTVVVTGSHVFFSLRLAKLVDETFQAEAIDGDSELGAATFAIGRS